MADSTSLTPQELAQRFAQMVMMQAQNILYLLGRLAGPHGEAPPPQLPEAKMLIDQLEMLQVKTEGNLSPQEAKLLENSLTQMRLAFVEASGGTTPAMMPSSPAYSEFSAEAFPEEEPAPEPTAAPTPSAPKTEKPSEPEEEKKKFFKSYG